MCLKWLKTIFKENQIFKLINSLLNDPLFTFFSSVSYSLSSLFKPEKSSYDLEISFLIECRLGQNFFKSSKFEWLLCCDNWLVIFLKNKDTCLWLINDEFLLKSIL